VTGDRPGGRRPNILLIVLDALRADAVEAYGAPSGATPILAELARRGTAVANVRATAPWTLPSHVAMFTGQLARGLGLGQAPGGSPHGAAPVVRAQRDRLLAEVLRQAGYATGAVTGNVWAGQASGFDTGFERFAELDSSRQNVLGGGLRNRLKWDWEAVRARADDGAARAEQVLTGWIDELDARPFFWFVNLVDCHGPYLPPKPWHGASALTRLRTADEAHRYLTFDAILQSRLGVIRVPEGALQRMRRLYAASVRYADAWVGRLLAALESVGQLEQTLVAVCSDHGENFGEDGLMTHGLSLDERLLRVPLITAGPGASALEGMLSLSELPSRLGAAVRLHDHPWDSGLVDGLAVAQWEPWELGEERVSQLRAQWQLGDQAMHRLLSPLTAAISGRFKLVRGADADEQALYDLAADPLERAPLTDEGAMAARAGDTLAQLRAAVESPAAQARPNAVPAADTASAEEVADIERRMRLMGYM
jgi:arylsulfatase A-like enzyme